MNIPDNLLYGTGTLSLSTGDNHNVQVGSYATNLSGTVGAAFAITGFLGEPYDASLNPSPKNARMTFVNTSSYTCTIKNLNIGSTAENQIKTSTGSDMTITAGNSMTFVYDQANLVWRDVSVSGGGGGSGTRTISKPAIVFNPSGITGTANILIDPYAAQNMTVTGFKAYRVGGTGAVVNARKNGSLTFLVSNLSLTSSGTTFDGGTLQNTAIAAGDTIELQVVSTAGSPTQINIELILSIP